MWAVFDFELHEIDQRQIFRLENHSLSDSERLLGDK